MADVNFLTAFTAFWIGLILDAVWMHGIHFRGKHWHLPDKKIEKYPRLRFTVWLEHYHLALILGILYPTLERLELLGFAAAFLIAEHFQDHPYALGSNHFKQSAIIGLLLTLLLLTEILLQLK